MSSFNVVSEKINITDPCYNVGTWCGFFNLPAKNGLWIANIDTNNNHVASLEAHHLDCKTSDYDEDWVKLGEVGVDSGQVGIYDSSIYPTGDLTGEFNDEDSFYGQVCTRAANSKFIENGITSSSGYGDGQYECYVIRDNETIIAVKVIFIDENEDEQTYGCSC